MKDFLLGLGELDADDIAEFERNFRFDEMSVQEIEEMLDIDVLERLCAQLDTPCRDVGEVSESSSMHEGLAGNDLLSYCRQDIDTEYRG